MTKIFIFVVDRFRNGDVVAGACGEDGQAVAQHLSSSGIFVRHDMGLTSKWKHELYDQAYPEGWELVDLTDLTEEELAAHVELNAALDKGIEELDEPSSK